MKISLGSILSREREETLRLVRELASDTAPGSCVRLMTKDATLATWYEALNSAANTVYTRIGVSGDKVASEYAIRATAVMSELTPHVLGRKANGCLYVWARSSSVLYAFALYSYLFCPRDVVLLGIPGSDRAALPFGDADKLVESFLVAGMLMCAQQRALASRHKVIAKAIYGRLSEARTARALVMASPLYCMVSGAGNVGRCGLKALTGFLRGVGLEVKLLRADTSTHKVIIVFMK